jgi:hypothetical protein
LDAHRRRYVAQAAGFGNESASDRSEDEPHRRWHTIAEKQAEGEENLMRGGWPLKKERELIKLARGFSLPFPESKRGRISATPLPVKIYSG